MSKKKKQGKRKTKVCKKCRCRLALATLVVYSADPDQEPYTDGVIEPVMVSGVEQEEIGVISDISCYICPDCGIVDSVWVEGV